MPSQSQLLSSAHCPSRCWRLHLRAQPVMTVAKAALVTCAADLSGRQPPNSPRPPLAQCGEAEFLDDVCAFLTGKRGKRLTRAAFPDAQVRNGFLHSSL